MNKPITSVTNGPVEFPPNTRYWSFHLQIVQTQSFVCPSRRQNRSPLISDCFHMLSKTVKKKKIQSSLNRDYVGHFISASLPSGRKREWECARNHLVCSLLSLPKSPAAYFEIQQWVLYLQPWIHRNSQHTSHHFFNRPQYVVDDVWLVDLLGKWVVYRWCLLLSTILCQDKSFSFGVKVCSDICSLHMCA